MRRIHKIKTKTVVKEVISDENMEKILGHSQIDTTMQYAIVNQNNVKNSHQRYMA